MKPSLILPLEQLGICYAALPVVTVATPVRLSVLV